ncbi:EamA family transporter [Candidatus Micrarchaeota archaeon]|nr:EamA family transporter [Candidatus Micrarchaeota archaeon]
MVEWYVYALVTMLFFSFGNIALKELLKNDVGQIIEKNQPIFLTAVGVLVAILVILYFTHLRFLVMPSDFGKLTLLFLLLAGIGFISLIMAVQSGKIALVTAIVSSSSVMVAILSVLLLNDTLSIKEWGGIVLVTSGVMLIIR